MTTGLYRIVSGKFLRRVGGRLERYVVGELVELAHDLAERLGTQVQRVDPEPAAAPSPEPVAPADPNAPVVTDPVAINTALADTETPEAAAAAREAEKDAEVHGTPAADAVVHIAAIGDGAAPGQLGDAIAHLVMIGEREGRNPKYQGGRATVIQAVEKRLAALRQQQAAAAANAGAGQ